MNKIKFFIGYSGWESGQLDSELQENSWLTANATRKIVLMFPWKIIWKESIEHLGGKYKIMVNFLSTHN